MRYLVDTGVLLRLFHRTDPSHQSIYQCFRKLKQNGHRLALSAQNIAEFWNVSTRPQSSRGGLGLSVEQTNRRVSFLERICDVIPDSPAIYTVWRRLVLQYQVKGVQVHDARLVAWMQTQAITHIITLNGADFSRFSGITPENPKILLEK